MSSLQKGRKRSATDKLQTALLVLTCEETERGRSVQKGGSYHVGCAMWPHQAVSAAFFHKDMRILMNVKARGEVQL